MKLIIKYILKSITEKKVRALLIIFAVVLSTAAFFSVISITDSITATYHNMLKFVVGDSNLHVHDSNQYFTYKNKTNKLDCEYVIRRLDVVGNSEGDLGEDIAINLIGINYEELKQYNEQDLLTELHDLKDNEIIISQNTKDTYQVDVGDTVCIKILNQKKKFKIAGISESTRLFEGEMGYAIALISYDWLETFLAQSGLGENLVTHLYVKAHEEHQVAALKATLKGFYPSICVEQSIKENEVHILTQMMKSCFSMVLMLVLFMSVFIIYSSIKVLMKERLPVIGTFRSVGATTYQIFAAFIMESILYGIVGGVIGDLVGIQIFKFISNLVNPYKTSGVEAVVLINPQYLKKALMIAVVTTVVSAIIPILQMIRMPIKNIIFQVDMPAKKTNLLRLIFAVVSIGCCIFCIPYLSGNKAFLLGCIIIICTMIGAIFLVPYVVSFIVFLVSKILGNRSKTDIYIPVWNLRNNKTLINSTTIIMVAIAIVTIVYQCLASSQNQLIGSYEYYQFDLSITSSYADDNFVRQLKKENGVVSAYGNYRTENVSERSKDLAIKRLDGVDDVAYLDYMKVEIEDAEHQIAKLKEGKYILIGEMLSKALKLQIGDMITLYTDTAEETYTISGIFGTHYIQSGYYALISKHNFEKLIGSSVYDEIWLNVEGDQQAIMDKLRKEYVDKSPIISTKEEQQEEFAGFYKIVTDPMGYLAMLALFIGLFGVLNNFTLSFIERTKSFAVLRSVGMDIGQQKRMLVLESLVLGCIGSGMGILLSYIILPAVPILTETMGSILLAENDKDTCILFNFMGIAISLVGSCINLRKIKTTSIVNGIKYE